MRIKEWFLIKNFNDNERYAMSVSDITIERETEKAYLLKFESDFGSITKWIPKSCIMTDEEEKEVESKIEDGFNKYEKLIAWAKENGIKVRNRMKKSTVVSIIKKSGFEIPAELV